MTYAGPWSAEYIESQYERWKNDPEQVSREWQFFFQGFELGYERPQASAEEMTCDEDMVRKQSRVEALVYRYRDIGHLLSCLDPLVACPTSHPLLEPSAFGLADADMDTAFYVPGVGETRTMTLKEILQWLRQTYCRSVGVEYMHLQDPDEREWLRERMESVSNRPSLDTDEKVRILNKLSQARRFEQFIHKKYLGQKRFSLEGADAIIPMIDSLFNHAAGYDCTDIVIGMAHRGRLNVETNILGKLYEDIFRDFENQYNPDAEVGAGDVKYHKGHSATIKTKTGAEIGVTLPSNPSHLESVNPVVVGMVRALLDTRENGSHHSAMPVLLHGDAAFAGQGIVAETLNMAQLDGYRTGGTIHIIINNQIGYTTLPEDARSTRYSTDIAKGYMVPIFHVHGEDPEAVIHITKLACDYRMKFGKDVVIDVVGYRRYGHNEGDEPYFTQPEMYGRIKARPSLDEIYAGQLAGDGMISNEAREKIESDINDCLQAAFDTAKEEKQAAGKSDKTAGKTDKTAPAEGFSTDTPVEKDALLEISEKLVQLPEDFHLHKKLQKLHDKRRKAVGAGEGIDWAAAELLAFGSILTDGIPVRLSGEDSQRGTFSQRHSVLFDVESNAEYIPLNHLSENQAPFYSINSPLSEPGVLGFDYGYSLKRPDALTLWEAQFGDFINNAQAMVDLYIASGETKWGNRSGLVLLLPHGYEGQGPEHSSARFERFLQLCAEDNIEVCYPTTPAQYFHLLRRQAVGKILKPLIVMTPKSLLRHPRAVSVMADFTDGGFYPVLDAGLSNKKVKKAIFVSGKLYYELAQAISESETKDIALIRIEQFYPFPEEEIKEVMSRYKSAENWLWVQEEPENMGGWWFIDGRFRNRLDTRLNYIGRNASASPATGYPQVFKQDQERIVKDAVSGS
ncbi:MAG: 2-oxoglutarate dehydrogenase E1 component [Desulfobacterales bacterium]|nr:2-oxoglutarate dehydrogenase E1 component [Desulfobacterales bacterium]